MAAGLREALVGEVAHDAEAVAATEARGIP